MVHETSHEEYRARFGLPWRRGLVSPSVSKRLSRSTTERIRNGSFKPAPDNQAAVARIREGGRRKDQPCITAAKTEMGKEQSKRNRRYGSKDFEKVMLVMLKCQTTLRQVCMMHKNLPPAPTVLRYAELNQGFRKRLLDTYHALPYAVQARAGMLSVRFFEDMRRLKAKGLSAKEIGERLHVNWKTVLKHLKQTKGSDAELQTE
jgi:hypothetical protein